jgi:CheY-like chemotaxis protein
MESATTRPIILYAEDDQDDFESVREAMLQITDRFSLVHAKNGEEAIRYLENSTSDTLPSLIVLDLNMPIMSGKDTLVWLKAQTDFRNLPVMVFTTSSREEDVKLCQGHGCTFFRKPTLYRDLLHVVQMMLKMSEETAAKSV